MDDAVELPKAPELPKAVKLDEDAELRVLAGTSSILNEAKKMKKEDKTEKVDEGGLDMNLLKGAQGAMDKNPKDSESDKNVKKKYGYRMDGEPAERDDEPNKQERRGRKRKNEEVEDEGVEISESDLETLEQEEEIEESKNSAREKFLKMVEAKKSKPDFLDVDKDGDKKEPMKKAAKEAGKSEKKDGKKGMSAKQEKYFGKKKTESAKTSKKVVAESVETKLSFKDMIKLVQESGGQQQIDPLDKALFAWATRIAQQKFEESTKAEVYAGLVYERMGGRFEMFDVLAENQK